MKTKKDNMNMLTASVEVTRTVMEHSVPLQGLADRLNLFGLAEAHVQWKARLGHYVEGRLRESYEGVMVGQSGMCQLGSLINGSALVAFHHTPAFHALREAHRDFHIYGDLVLERLQTGERTGAKAAYYELYVPALHRLIEALATIQRQL